MFEFVDAAALRLRPLRGVTPLWSEDEDEDGGGFGTWVALDFLELRGLFLDGAFRFLAMIVK